VRQLSNHHAISSERGGRYGQYAGMEDKICEARRAVWHKRGEISEDPM